MSSTPSLRMSFFDEAVDQFITDNPGLSQTYTSSSFLQKLEREVQLMIENCKGSPWTHMLAEQIKSQLNNFFTVYEGENPTFKYNVDCKLFYNTKQLYVDYKEVPSDQVQTVWVSIAT